MTSRQVVSHIQHGHFMNDVKVKIFVAWLNVSVLKHHNHQAVQGSYLRLELLSKSSSSSIIEIFFNVICVRDLTSDILNAASS
jgi:hypothetical protein